MQLRQKKRRVARQVLLLLLLPLLELVLLLGLGLLLRNRRRVPVLLLPCAQGGLRMAAQKLLLEVGMVGGGLVRVLLPGWVQQLLQLQVLHCAQGALEGVRLLLHRVLLRGLLMGPRWAAAVLWVEAGQGWGRGQQASKWGTGAAGKRGGMRAKQNGWGGLRWTMPLA